jgi:ribosomal-protein-alanine N-acetyltransferase
MYLNSPNLAKNVNLQVRVSNEAARKLYKKVGFEETKLLKNYYPPPDEEDGLLMIKKIKSL